MQGRVDLNKFTEAVNTFESVFNQLNRSIEDMISAKNELNAAMTGAEAELIKSNIQTLSEEMNNSKKTISDIITKIKSENTYYHHSLGVSDGVLE